jgi:hypothetical protein
VLPVPVLPVRPFRLVPYPEQHQKYVDDCLQLFGGYGYMREYPIAQMYADARV